MEYSHEDGTLLRMSSRRNPQLIMCTRGDVKLDRSPVVGSSNRKWWSIVGIYFMREPRRFGDATNPLEFVGSGHRSIKREIPTR